MYGFTPSLTGLAEQQRRGAAMIRAPRPSRRYQP
jgi:hypothetical protein